MATTTPNFGWSVPTSTDLVKDGATAIETLGDSIDASLVDLKGGTSGQVLAKNSNTDMDFIWVAQDDSNAIQNDIVDAKGDLISATAADTPARLAVGTNGHVLTADSTTATGLKWAAAAAGGMTELASGSLSTGSGTLSLTSISGSYKNLQLVIRDWYPSTNAVGMAFTCNAVTSYDYVSMFAVTDNSTANSEAQIAAASVIMYYNAIKNVDGDNSVVINIYDYANTSSSKLFNSIARYTNATSNIGQVSHIGGAINTTAAITSISWGIPSGGGNFAAGTYVLYGVN